jgi:hypothetical protein
MRATRSRPELSREARFPTVLQRICACGVPRHDLATDASRFVGGEDTALTMKTIILVTRSSGVGIPTSFVDSGGIAPERALVVAATLTGDGIANNGAPTAWASQYVSLGRDSTACSDDSRGPTQTRPRYADQIPTYSCNNCGLARSSSDVPPHTIRPFSMM